MVGEDEEAVEGVSNITLAIKSLISLHILRCSM